MGLVVAIVVARADIDEADHGVGGESALRHEAGERGGAGTQQQAPTRNYVECHWMVPLDHVKQLNAGTPHANPRARAAKVGPQVLCQHLAGHGDG
jgi:hypothetical protein